MTSSSWLRKLSANELAIKLIPSVAPLVKIISLELLTFKNFATFSLDASYLSVAI